MGDEATQECQRSLAAPLIFLIVAAFQLAYYWLDHLKKNVSDDEKEIQLRGEIKQLLKEASLMSQPSTFAQAAKLKRLAVIKERELAKYQNSQHKDLVLYLNMVLVAKYLTYGMLLIWFWRVPVASISQQLVQPFGRLLSWKTGAIQSNDVIKFSKRATKKAKRVAKNLTSHGYTIENMVGIIAWLIVSARVCRFVRRACSK